MKKLTIKCEYIDRVETFEEEESGYYYVEAKEATYKSILGLFKWKTSDATESGYKHEKTDITTKENLLSLGFRFRDGKFYHLAHIKINSNKETYTMGHDSNEEMYERYDKIEIALKNDKYLTLKGNN